MVSNTAYVHKVSANIAADCGDIRMHGRPHVCIKKWLSLFGAEDNVENDCT